MTTTNSDKKEKEVLLSKEQGKEILKRDKDLTDGITFSKDWKVVKHELLKIYR
jgi:hypothetical protein